MKPQPLIGALPIIAKMLGRKLGVEVVIGAPQAATDGNTIFLPALPATDPAVAILANGYIDHEAAHLRFTDWSLPKPERPLESQLVNILEDVRIEQALGQQYPGTRVNLARLAAAMVERGEFAIPTAETPLAQALLSYLLHRLRADVLGQTALTAFAGQGEARLRQALSPGVVVKLHALAFEVVNTVSTADVMRLAKRIIEMLQDEAKQAAADPASTDSTGETNPSHGDPPGRDAGAAADAGADASSDVPAPADSAVDAAPASADTPTGDTPAQSSTIVPPTPPGDQPDRAAGERPAGTLDAAAALRSLVAANAADCGTAGDLGTQVATLLDARAAASVTPVVMAEYNRAPANVDPEPLARQARAATAPLRRRLASLVQASRETDAWHSRRGRRLYGRDLYRLRLNDPTVFIRRDEQPAPDTAVYLLLDRSRSMRRMIELAAQAALAIALALEAIPGVAVAVSAFPGSDEDRLVPLVGFDERSSVVAGRFRLCDYGNTPLQNALWRAGFELLSRHELRRLVLTVTDGDPQNVPGTQEVIARCRVSGIEVLGLGINAGETVLKLFGPAHAASIDDIQQLAPALFRLLEQQLAQHLT